MNANHDRMTSMDDVSDVARVFAVRAIGGRASAVDVFGDVVHGDTYRARAAVAAIKGDRVYVVTMTLARRGEGYAATSTSTATVADVDAAIAALDAFKGE